MRRRRALMAEAPEFAFNIFDPAVKADPYPLYEEMRATGRVVANPFLAGQLHGARATTTSLALLNDPETFSNGRLGGPAAPSASFLAADDAQHRPARPRAAPRRRGRGPSRPDR